MMGKRAGRLAALAAAACALVLTAGAAGGERAVNELAKLTDPEGAEWDHFGRALAVDGEVAVVGAPHADDWGVVFVFRDDGGEWCLEARLEPSDPGLAAEFGGDVAIDGTKIIVGDAEHYEQGKGGAAYVFRFDGSSWLEEAKILAPDGEANDRFGDAVALVGTVAVIGAPGDDDLGSSSGSVYIFSPPCAVWEQTAKLTRESYEKALAQP